MQQRDTSSSGTDPTVAFDTSGSSALDTAGSSRQWVSMGGTPRAKVSIVEGERKSLSAEARETLRARLRAATVPILFGFAIYLVRSYFDQRPLQGFHTFVVFGLCAAFAILISRIELTTTHLRLLEGWIFGLPVVFFAPYHYFCVIQEMETGYAVGIVAIYKNVVGYWYTLLVIYGLFVPSNWKRTAIVCSPIAVLPVLVGVLAAILHPEVRAHLGVSELTDTAMILCVGMVCAAYGSEVIRSLRQQATEAKQFGQYRLLDPLGKGGMGEVFKAEHQLLKRPCAIKLIRGEHAGNPQALARFEREVRTTAKLTHWNTIDIYDYGRTSDGAFYYVMEYLPGLSLRELIDAAGPMPPARVVHIVSQVCSALAEAHGAALIHRDINTGNIFITERGGINDVAKLLDFGLVKAVDSNAEATQITQVGMVSGTPKYMSPEQASAEGVAEIRSDLYSLGAVAYEMLTGRVPFEGSNGMQIMISHVRDPAPPLRQFKDDIPEELEAIVLRCLEKKPDDRFPSAAALRDALEACVLADEWTHSDAAAWWRDYDATHITAESNPTELTPGTEQTMPMQAAAPDEVGEAS